MERDYNTRRKLREMTTELLFLIGGDAYYLRDVDVLRRINMRLEAKRDKLVLGLTGINLKEV